MKKLFLLLLCSLLCSCLEDPKTGVPKLVKQLKSSDSHERSRAAQKLAAYKKDAADAVPALVKCLNTDDNDGVKSMVAYALRLIDTPEGNKALDNYKK
ncbi:MAG: HEAT repeat domain-containing protein [Proteobacteria bacterium]|nr:HEAT repeat domain-containing protein [Pseudomonadota bacterium]